MTKLSAIDGKPVIDGKRPLSFTVTGGDIKGADRKRPENCVIARACRRELKAEEVRVHLSRTYVRTNEGNWQRYITPKDLRSELIAYDRGGSFASGEYTLPAPQPSKQLGKKRGGKKFVRRGNKRKKPHVVTDIRTGPA